MEKTTTIKPEIENRDRIQEVQIVDEMQKAYLDYAMSVIVSRALPDARDGLKPVQRRIIYAAYEIGALPTSKYQKCAKIVGEVLAKYHPHDNVSVYDAMVRMAQKFSMRYTLIDGQGNFGSIDGDSAAAMRYTEAKMSKISEEMLVDIDKDTVDMIPNFDGTLNEPVYLPAKLPNLLLMGSDGIAVGMATKIPPHNLTEVVDAAAYQIDHPEATVEELMQFVKGPDFPTFGAIYDHKAIAEVYATGRGRIVVRGKAEIEEAKGGKTQIVITEIPHQVNKAEMVARIAELYHEKKLDGISDLRDESDREGIRVVVDLKRDAKPKSLLNNIYKHTALQTTFPANFVALVDGTPQTLGLKQILAEYIRHRQVVITRRTEFDLKSARARAHILEGLTIALDHLDAVIKTIRESADSDIAKKNLMESFKLSELQAVAILDM